MDKLLTAYALNALEAAGYEEGEKNKYRFARVDNIVTFTATVQTVNDVVCVTLQAVLSMYQHIEHASEVIRAPLTPSEIHKGERMLIATLYERLKNHRDVIEANYQAAMLNYAAVNEWLDERR